MTIPKLAIVLSVLCYLLSASAALAVSKYPASEGLDNLSPGTPNYVFNPVTKSRGLKKEVINPGELGYDEYMREIQGSTITCVDQTEAPWEVINQELLTCNNQWCGASGHMSTSYDTISSFALSQTQTQASINHPKYYTDTNVALSVGFNQNRALTEGMITKEQSQNYLNMGTRTRIQDLARQLEYSCERCRTRAQSKSDNNQQDEADDDLDSDICGRLLNAQPRSEVATALLKDVIENPEINFNNILYITWNPADGQQTYLHQLLPSLPFATFKSWGSDHQLSEAENNQAQSYIAKDTVSKTGNQLNIPRLCLEDPAYPQALIGGETKEGWRRTFYTMTRQQQNEALSVQASVSKAWGYEIIYHTWEGIDTFQNNFIDILLQNAVQLALPNRVIVNQFEVPGCIAGKDEVYAVAKDLTTRADYLRLKNEAIPPKNPPPDLTTHTLEFGGTKIDADTINLSKITTIRDKDGTLRPAVQPWHVPVLNLLQQQNISCKEFDPESSDFMGAITENNSDIPKIVDIISGGQINLEGDAFKNIKFPHYYIWLVNPPCARQGSELSFTHPKALYSRFYHLSELPVIPENPDVLGTTPESPPKTGSYLENRDLRQSVLRSTEFTHEEQVQVGTETVQNPDGTTEEKPIYKTASAGYEDKTVNASFRFGELAERLVLQLRGHKLLHLKDPLHLPFENCVYTGLNTVMPGLAGAMGVPRATQGCQGLFDYLANTFFLGSEDLNKDLQNRAAASCGASSTQTEQFLSYWAYLFATIKLETPEAFNLTSKEFQSIQNDAWWQQAGCSPNSVDEASPMCVKAYCYDRCQNADCAPVCWTNQGTKTSVCEGASTARETTVMGLGQVEESTYEGSSLENPPPNHQPRDPAGAELMSRCNAKKSLDAVVAKANAYKPPTCSNWTYEDLFTLAMRYCGATDPEQLTNPALKHGCYGYHITLIAWYNQFMQDHGQPMIPGVKPMPN